MPQRGLLVPPYKWGRAGSQTLTGSMALVLRIIRPPILIGSNSNTYHTFAIKSVKSKTPQHKADTRPLVKRGRRSDRSTT